MLQCLKGTLPLSSQGVEDAAKAASHSLLGNSSFRNMCLLKVLAKVRDSNNGCSVSYPEPWELSSQLV